MFTLHTFNIFHIIMFFVISLLVGIVSFLTICKLLDKINVDLPDVLINLMAAFYVMTVFCIFEYKIQNYSAEDNNNISNISALSYINNNLEVNDPIVEILQLHKNHKIEPIKFDLSNKVIYNLEVIRQYWGNQIVLLSYLENNNNDIENKKVVVIMNNNEYQDFCDKMTKYKYHESNWTQKYNKYEYNYKNIDKMLALQNIPWNFIPE